MTGQVYFTGEIRLSITAGHMELDVWFWGVFDSG